VTAGPTFMSVLSVAVQIGAICASGWRRRFSWPSSIVGQSATPTAEQERTSPTSGHSHKITKDRG